MRESGFWGLLGDGERESLRATARPRAFAGNAILCLEGEPSTHVFILLSGWVKVIAVTGEGREMLAGLRGEGDIVGEIAQVTGYRTATVQAIGTVRTLIVAAERFEVFLDSHASAARAYRRVMTEYQRAAHISQRSKHTSSGPRRLASLLLDLAEGHGERTRSGLRTALPLSQEELASLIGSSRSTVTRALSDWRSRNVIATHPRHITILDQPALYRIAGRLSGISRSSAPNTAQECDPLRGRKREHRARRFTRVPHQHRQPSTGDFDAVLAVATAAALTPRQRGVSALRGHLSSLRPAGAPATLSASPVI